MSNCFFSHHSRTWRSETRQRATGIEKTRRGVEKKIASRNRPMVTSWLLAAMAVVLVPFAAYAEDSFSGNVGRPSAIGSDVSPLPGDFPHAHWAPIADQLLGSSLRMLVQVNGKNTHVILDTGAQSTTLSFPVAKALGIKTKGKGVRSAKVVDAHGKKMGAVRTTADRIRIGGKTFNDVDVLVVGHASNMFVVGYTLLSQFDLYIAADHGLVGFFSAGAGPHLDGEAVFSVGGTARRQMYIFGRTKDSSGNMRDLRFLVDTGASQTSIPARLGLEKNLGTSVNFESRHGSVSGVPRTARAGLCSTRFFSSPAGSTPTWDVCSQSATPPTVGLDCWDSMSSIATTP